MENGHHEDHERLFKEIEEIEQNMEGVVDYLSSVNTIKHVGFELLKNQGETKQVIYSGSEDRNFITDTFFHQEQVDDVLPLIMGESIAFYDLLICRDSYPDNTQNNNHLTIFFNSTINSDTQSDYIFSSQVIHLFADSSSAVFNKGWKIGSLDAIQQGELGPYVHSEEEQVAVINTLEHIKLSPAKFKSQHWSPDMLYDKSLSEILSSEKTEGLIDSKKPFEDLYAIADYMAYEFREHLPSN